MRASPNTSFNICFFSILCFHQKHQAEVKTFSQVNIFIPAKIVKNKIPIAKNIPASTGSGNTQLSLQCALLISSSLERILLK
jgi:hypothetical protein